ncbi:MAG: ketoacyl-ACP synthase III [Bacteroidales bacterium]|jgi:3-oxoacyl-[acyl-carrier-protein] synthase-3
MEIRTIEYYLPENVLSNELLANEFPEWDAEKINEKIGINQRHVVANDETALDLAFFASEKVLKSFDKDLIDFILLCTQSPDYYLPTSACILQNRLDLKTNIGALDFNLGCSGFVYGLALAKGLIQTRIATNVLLVTAETYSKHIHPKDKANRSIFGDGAAATIISESAVNKIFEFELGTDGSGMNNLIVHNGAFRNKFNPSAKETIDESGNLSNKNYLYMNGPEIFNFTIENVPALVKKVLEKNSLSLESIDYVIFHQANKYMLDYLRKKIKIPIEKFYQNMENTGNTVSSTIPIALKDCIERNLVKNGDKILLAGFGVGYSWGATIIQV